MADVRILAGRGPFRGRMEAPIAILEGLGGRPDGIGPRRFAPEVDGGGIEQVCSPGLAVRPRREEPLVALPPQATAPARPRSNEPGARSPRGAPRKAFACATTRA